MNTEMAPTMRLAISDDEGQTVIDALIDYINSSNPSRNAVCCAWNVIAEMAVESHRMRKARDNGNDHAAESSGSILQFGSGNEKAA